MFARFDNGGTANLWRTYASHDELWLTFDVAFDGTNPASFGIQAIAQIMNGVGFFGTTMFDLEWFFGVWQDAMDSGLSSATPVPPLSPTWMTVEMHWKRGTAGSGYTDGITEVYINGVLLWADLDYYDLGSDQAMFGGLSGAPVDRVFYVDNVKIGTTRGGTEIFSDDFESGTFAAWNTPSGGVSIVSAFDLPPVVPTLAPPSFEWRFIVTKLNGRTLALLDRIATQRQVTYTLNKPAVATGVVPSDNPTVNLVQSDGFPILEEGVRCLLGFRRENVDFTPHWFCRFAGIIMQVEDNVDENGGVAPYTTYTAYDPRQLLYSRPVRTASGDLPGPNGVTFSGQRGDVIVKALLDRSLAADGDHYIGIFSSEATDVISSINFQQGASVGEAFDQITATGNCDIIFEPDYIPALRPGSLASVTVYKLAGYNFDGTPDTRHKAPLSWDKPRRNLVHANRLKDGTQRANRIQFYSGAGGPPVGVESNFAAAAQYGNYWAQQFFTTSVPDAVSLLASEQLTIRAKGVKTYKVDPVPGSLGQIDSPILFLDYTLGTILPVFASKRLRKKIAVGKRVISIPVVIRDDGVETVSQLEFGEGEVEVS